MVTMISSTPLFIRPLGDNNISAFVDDFWVSTDNDLIKTFVKDLKVSGDIQGSYRVLEPWKTP